MNHRMLFALFICAAALSATVHADAYTDPYTGLTYSGLPDEERLGLPAMNVYDPWEQRNRPITQFSYEQLSAWMENPSFRSWNDIASVCESMDILFDRVPVACRAAHVPVALTPGTARAYVSFEIAQPPVRPAFETPRAVLIVDPVYPPWSPTYNPYW